MARRAKHDKEVGKRRNGTQKKRKQKGRALGRSISPKGHKLLRPSHASVVCASSVLSARHTPEPTGSVAPNSAHSTCRFQCSACCSICHERVSGCKQSSKSFEGLGTHVW
eukprot:6186424-Pleurochrysis_carterae.AAC.1